MRTHGHIRTAARRGLPSTTATTATATPPMTPAATPPTTPAVRGRRLSAPTLTPVPIPARTSPRAIRVRRSPR
ncbi:hypothetical protein [Streptomyces beigongshangae]|uniref:hypothetical protein n=1 Tax=Streptomyces beigongshangae TaxID=2841597 RepID=UPI001C85886C|nr:hypothetical protein [Streptomyces sp. REN17]